jgi:hypothetical protein
MKVWQEHKPSCIICSLVDPDEITASTLNNLSWLQQQLFIKDFGAVYFDGSIFKSLSGSGFRDIAAGNHGIQ